MGYALTFYGLSLDELRQELAHPSKDLSESARQAWMDVYSIKNPEAVWDGILHRFSEAMASPNLKWTLTEQEGNALVAMVGEVGFLLGALNHASASGDRFLKEFLGVIASKSYRVSDLLDRVTDRPFSGLAPSVFPGWGFLDRQEIRDMVATFRHPPELSEDNAIWLQELQNALMRATSLDTDVFTVYL